MTLCSDGLTKLMEECGELIQVLAKKQVYFNTDVHPDGKGSLQRRMEEEIADVRAASTCFVTVVKLKKSIVIYRAHCSDGFSGAWVFWKMFGNAFEYYPGVYGQEPPDCTDRNVYLVDFSYRREVVEGILSKCKSLIILDHHSTAINDLSCIENPKLWTVFDLNRSGAMIAWDYVFTDRSPPLLLGHIQNRDLWQFKLPNTREIQQEVFSHEYSFEKWDELMSADQVKLLQMTVAGAAIERKHQKDIKELLEVTRRYMTIGGHVVPVASLPYTMVSDAAGQMAVGEHFAACYWDTNEHRIFGLRSTERGLDVSKVAERYGGGGHKHAAGFKVHRDHELAKS